MLQDSHIDLVLFVGFLISLCEQAIIAAAGRRLRRHQESNAAGAHVLFNFMSCPLRLSQDLFLCMRYVRKRSYFSLFLVCRTIRRIRRKFPWVPSLVFLLSIPWPSFSARQFVLQCLTGVHGALDRRHHRCASGTRSSTRCCSRAVAFIRLQIREQIVDVPVPRRKPWRLLQVRSSATVVQASGDSTGGRAHIEQIVDVSVPRILEQNVDVIKVILQEQCQRTRFFF